MWSWRLVWLCWWSCSCSTSSSLVATHPKTSYSSVIDTTMCISQLIATYNISKYTGCERLMPTMHCSGANSKSHKRIFRILCENMNCIQCDSACYVESCLDWSGSQQSLIRLLCCMTDPNPCRLSTFTVHLLNILALLLSPWLIRRKAHNYLEMSVWDWTPH